MADHRAGAGEDDMSYEAFGVRFFEYAVTERRIESALCGLAGQPIDFGPKPVMGVARVAASGAIGVASVVQTAPAPAAFAVTIPVDLDVSIRLAGAAHRFHADVRVRLALTARAAKPLRVRVDVEPPGTQDVEIRLEARNWGASMLNAMGSIEHELRRVVVAQVKQRLASPEIRALREFDLRPRIDKALGG